MDNVIFDKVKKDSKLPDQNLKIGDLVYSEYYKQFGEIARLSAIQEIPDNPAYVLKDIQGKEIVFGVREHMWCTTDNNTITYYRLIKIKLPKNNTYSSITGEQINEVPPDNVDNTNERHLDFLDECAECPYKRAICYQARMG